MSLEPLHRLAEKDVAPTVEKHLGHWENLETQTGAPYTTPSGFTRDFLGNKLADWDALGDKILDGGKSEISRLVLERDAFWGHSAKDTSGAWFWLGNYKKAVSVALAPLPRTPETVALVGRIPNLGNPAPGTIPAIFQKFAVHWAEVNAALGAASKPAMTVGNYTLAALEAARDGWNQTQDKIGQLGGQIPNWRAQHDVILGDFSADNRESDSLLGILYDYHFGVETGFPGSTYAQTLPRIFPKQPSDKEPPRFAYNFEAIGSNIEVWFHVELGSEATLLFLKEGAETQVKPIPEGQGWKTIGFSGITIADGIDRLEQRGQNNQIVAFGKRDENLVKP